MTRISPNFRAKDFTVGTIKIGNNGEKWVITVNVKGVKKWSKVNKMNIKKPKNISKEYILLMKKRYNIPKKDAKFAVVTYLDFYKQNYSKFLKYFKTLEEANNFAYSEALEEFNPDEKGASINFFGNKKIAKKGTVYRLPADTDDSPQTTPYKNKIISYIVNSTIYSVVRPYPGIENEWMDESGVLLTYYPDAYYPSNKSFPIYVDDGSLYESGELSYKNAKTGEVVQIPIPKKFL